MKRTRNGILIPDVPITAGGNLPNAVKGVSAGVDDNPLLTPFYIDVLTTLSLTNQLQISDDAQNWQVCGARTLNPGRYYFRGAQTTGVIRIGITSQEQYNIGGNIMSLISYDWSEATLYDSCFNEIFKNAKVVDASALLLPATTLANSCYSGMFYGCSSLTAAPVLPATTLTERCYHQMFYGCSSLTAAPVLPATTLAIWCYYRMFHGCSSLTAAPVLPATTLAGWCYYQMFQNCSSLSKIECYAVTFAHDSVAQWVDGVSSVGNFVKKSGITWSTGTSGIPDGWEVEEVD